MSAQCIRSDRIADPPSPQRTQRGGSRRHESGGGCDPHCRWARRPGWSPACKVLRDPADANRLPGSPWLSFALADPPVTSSWRIRVPGRRSTLPCACGLSAEFWLGTGLTSRCGSPRSVGSRAAGKRDGAWSRTSRSKQSPQRDSFPLMHDPADVPGVTVSGPSIPVLPSSVRGDRSWIW